MDPLEKTRRRKLTLGTLRCDETVVEVNEANQYKKGGYIPVDLGELVRQTDGWLQYLKEE